MKRTQFKDALRNIGKKKTAFLSICVIVFLGVSSFLWAGFVKAATEKSATEYYKKYKFADIEMYSSLGVTKYDIERIAEQDYVVAAEGVIQQSAGLSFGNEHKTVQLISLTSKVNVPEVLEGTLPVSENECALDKMTMEKNGLSIGDTVKISVTGFALKSSEFTVVGKINHPSYMRYGREYYAVVAQTAFDMKKTNDLYTKALVLLDVPDGIGIFSNEYYDYTASMEQSLTDLSLELGKRRDESIAAQITDVIRTKFGDKINNIFEMIGKILTGKLSLIPKLDEEIINIKNEAEEYFGSYGKIDNDRWVIQNRNTNEGYIDVRAVIKAMGTASGAFASLFLIVGAIVCFSTMAIIVNEQKKLIGATKAFGFFGREVFAKYAIFGLASTVAGLILGAITAYLLEGVLLKGFSKSYEIGPIRNVFSVGTTAVVVVAAVALSLLTTFFSCREVLKKPASALMSGSDDTKKRKNKSKARSHGTVFSRLIMRNMRNDISRVIVSVVIIIGCISIIGVGFSIKFGFDGMMKRHFKDVVKYDYKMNVESVDDAGRAELEKILDDSGASYVAVSEKGYAAMIGDVHDSTMIIFAEDEKVQDFFGVNDVDTGKPLELPSDGVIIQKRLAETSGLKAGDEIVIYDGALKPHTVKVSAIFQNYQGRIMVMSNEARKALLEEDPTYDVYYINLGESDESLLLEKLGNVSDGVSFVRGDAALQRVESFSKIINIAILGLTFAAIFMAYVILTNLTNIFVRRRMKDLAIMRINGFSSREAIRYLLRETMITNIVGIVSGVGIGGVTAYAIIRLMEQPEVQLVRTFNVPAWAIAVGLTALFSFIINSFAFSKVKKLKLTDAK